MKYLIILLLTIFSLNISAQSPFKRLDRPDLKYGMSPSANPYIKFAWRISAPTVGYLYTKGSSQIATSLGFGWTKNVWDTSNGGSWYTKIGINAVIIGGKNIAPDPTNPASWKSVGISATFLRGHISVGPVYNLPIPGMTPGILQNLGVFVVAALPIFPIN